MVNLRQRMTITRRTRTHAARDLGAGVGDWPRGGVGFNARACMLCMLLCCVVLMFQVSAPLLYPVVSVVYVVPIFLSHMYPRRSLVHLVVVGRRSVVVMVRFGSSVFRRRASVVGRGSLVVSLVVVVVVVVGSFSVSVVKKTSVR